MSLSLILSVAMLTPTADVSIDSILANRWQLEAIEPAPICTDEVFLRRVTLDLAGRIPKLEEVQAFRVDPNRWQTIERLLQSDEFNRWSSELWAATLVGYTNAFDSDRELLRRWLEKSFRDAVPYDRLVRELLNAKGESAIDGPTNFLVRHPQDPAVQLCRLFLGVRLDCARCHDHPFDRWTQEDFRKMSHFFRHLRRREISEGNIRLEDGLGGNDEEKPQFLTGATPRTSQWRAELALFVTNSKPFARTYANRIWYQLLGRGIIHPPDRSSSKDSAVDRELLEFLATEARNQQFAIRPMIRLICNSQVYQRSSRGPNRTTRTEALFADRVIKPLTPEQTIDSLSVALSEDFDGVERMRFIRRMTGESLDEDFSETWKHRETVQDLLRRLSLSIEPPARDIDQLYLRILSRQPTTQERRIVGNNSILDVSFALLNSNEFFFNH